MTVALAVVFVAMILVTVSLLYVRHTVREMVRECTAPETTHEITKIDTSEHKAPAEIAVSERPARVCRLPVYGAGSGGKPRCTVPENPIAITCTAEATSVADSMVAVAVPMEQKHYRDSTYEAWVSGFEPRLDSIRVYGRTRTVTVRIREYKPPDRWHVGLSAGYAYTPAGLRPYVGIGITYSLISF